MSARIIDLARNRSVIMRAGATTVPMTTSEMTIARVATDPTAYWRHEGHHITASEMTFGSLTLVARVLAVLVPVTIELLEDASNAGQVIQSAIAQALALELDRAALRGAGSGSSDPVKGVRYWTGVSTTAIGGVLAYDNLLDAMTPIESANGTPNAWILGPTINGVVRNLKDTTNQYLSQHPDIARLQKLVSNQVPEDLGDGSDESEIYCGDFASVLIGMRKRVTVEIFAAGRDSDDSFNAMTQLGRWIRVHLRADVAIEQAGSFNVLTGVTAA